MKRRPALWFLCLLPWAGTWAAPSLAGRWEGWARIPGAPLPLVIDLQTGSGTAWLGSVTLPGRGVKGAPLQDIVANAAGVRFSLAAAFGDSAPAHAAWAELRWQPDGRLAGLFGQGGHRAELVLSRSGPPQVDLPLPTRPFAPGLAGVWRGRYVLGGYARDVTITLTQAPDASASGEMLIVGKRRSLLAIDRIDVSGPGFVVLDSGSAGLRVEGRWNAAEQRIDGHFLQGPFEAEIVLRRDAGPVAP